MDQSERRKTRSQSRRQSSPENPIPIKVCRVSLTRYDYGQGSKTVSDSNLNSNSNASIANNGLDQSADDHTEMGEQSVTEQSFAAENPMPLNIVLPTLEHGPTTAQSILNPVLIEPEVVNRREILARAAETRLLGLSMETGLNTTSELNSNNDDKSSESGNETADSTVVNTAEPAVQNDTIEMETESVTTNEMGRINNDDKPTESVNETADSTVVNATEPVVQNDTIEMATLDEYANSMYYNVETAVKLRGKKTPFEWTAGGKLGTKLVYTTDERQLYVKNDTNKSGETFLVCRQKNCKARIKITADEECVFTQSYIGHQHGPEQNTQKKLKAVEMIKQSCSEIEPMGSSSKIGSCREIFYAKVAEADVEEIGLSYDAIKRNLLKIRSKILPKSPANVSEVTAAFENNLVRENYGLTIRTKGSERTMFYKHAFECDEYAYCLFASDDIVNALEKNVEPSRREHIFDATFGVCPPGVFTQFLILSTNFMGQFVPFAFALMSNKKEENYRAVFGYIHEKIIRLDCKHFMCDYERAMRNAFLSVVSGTRVTSCHFHFCQACKRNAAKYPTLVKLIQTDKKAAKIYYKLLSLPLLPSDEIRGAFDELQKEANSLSTLFNKFLMYFHRQWIDGKRESPETISVYGLSSRTTNSLEAINGQLGKLIPKHSHYFRFLRMLLKFERDKAYDVTLLVESGGASKNVKKTSTKTRDAKIKAASSDLMDGKITPMQFLDQMVFNANKQCANMLDFTNLSLLNEEQQEDEQLMASLEPSAADNKLCQNCYKNERNCFLDPCGHVFFCMACFEEWKKVDTSLFGLDEIYSTEELEALVSTGPLEEPRCPICREIIKEAKILRFS